ncbi:hypothetical protein GE09DRAFT_412226 [Coniochaeta sp. 2T2.1]|nr:hypothetical protein GE09DRAFT_412226 [Coniochaeta sp. 2T2.1]
MSALFCMFLAAIYQLPQCNTRLKEQYRTLKDLGPLDHGFGDGTLDLLQTQSAPYFGTSSTIRPGWSSQRQSKSSHRKTGELPSLGPVHIVEMKERYDLMHPS